MSDCTIRYASLADLERLAPLFNAYRVFYGQTSDPGLARSFLHERLTLRESVILLALDKREQALGFTQLYPGFSSVRAARLWILNDLYVADSARRLGVGSALLRAAKDHGHATGALRLTLSTTVDNHSAQSLYAAEGWGRDDDLFYVLPLDG